MRLPFLILALTSLAPLIAAEPAAVVPTLRSVHLQMAHGAEQDSADLVIELVASFPDGRLIAWQDATVVEAETDGGERLMPQGTPESTSNFGIDSSEDDLAVPLTVPLGGFTRPPARLAKLRIDAIAVLASGGTRELVLPLDGAGRTFAPQEDKLATVAVAKEQAQWKLTLSERLARRLMRVALRRADGTLAEVWVNQRERTPNRLVLDVQANNEAADARPVLMLAEKVEQRRVRLMGDGLALFGTTTDPELLPLGANPAGDPARSAPLEVDKQALP